MEHKTKEELEFEAQHSLVTGTSYNTPKPSDMKAEELDTKTRLAYKLSMLDESFRTSIIESINDRIEEVANQRVIEELELILSIEKETGIVPINALKHRLKELKQEV